ncbi:MAG: hypothetical protein IKY78_03460 [Clostridia bacterium]|nr:hypothetical protein [Clostridia bacterium]
MKKILAIVLALAVVLVCFAACGNKAETETPTDAVETTVADENNGDVAEDLGLDTVGLLSAIFATYTEENSFPIGGGDEANMSYEGPAKYDVSLVEELNVVAHLPATQNANVEEAANVMNMMNANSFTGAAYLLKDGTDVAAFAADFKADLDNAHWMCGFPEKFVVIQSGKYVITAYGLGANIDYFKTQAASALAGSTVVLEGDIAA